MASNSFGKNFTITSFGESHGKHIGAVLDGCPSGISLDFDRIQRELTRRRPGQSALTTQRNEPDEFEITSGLFEGKTTGAPICILIANKDSKPKDYNHLKDIYRPSHADYTYDKKFGIRDYKGGGRSSARVTAPWVAAGAIAKQLLEGRMGITILGYVQQIHTVQAKKSGAYTLDDVEVSAVRCPDLEASQSMIKLVEEARDEGDSLGGIVSCTIKNCPVGMGDPVFEKLNAQLAKAMMSINAAKGFQVGSGFDSVLKKGSELNDEWIQIDGKDQTRSNHSGGIQGGISNGMDIEFDVAFKPTATISKPQKTMSTSGKAVDLEASGRHDPCVVPRAVPIVEAMAALVIVDNLHPILVNKPSE